VIGWKTRNGDARSAEAARPSSRIGCGWLASADAWDAASLLRARIEGANMEKLVKRDLDELLTNFERALDDSVEHGFCSRMEYETLAELIQNLRKTLSDFEDW
jgi:hypothetical protein